MGPTIFLHSFLLAIGAIIIVQELLPREFNVYFGADKTDITCSDFHTPEI